MTTTRESESYARYALGLLLVVYAFNFIDRIILGILVPPIKADLHLTDTQLGLLGGTAFALFYTVLGIPIGWLADRFNRVWIMAISLAVWRAFAAGSGLAQNFGQLFLARLGLILAPLFRWSVGEPVRGRLDAAAPQRRTPSLPTVVRLLAGKVSF